MVLGEVTRRAIWNRTQSLAQEVRLLGNIAQNPVELSAQDIVDWEEQISRLNIELQRLKSWIR